MAQGVPNAQEARRRNLREAAARRKAVQRRKAQKRAEKLTRRYLGLEFTRTIEHLFPPIRQSCDAGPPKLRRTRAADRHGLVGAEVEL